jgi:hypothetical protein
MLPARTRRVKRPAAGIATTPYSVNEAAPGRVSAVAATARLILPSTDA